MEEIAGILFSILKKTVEYRNWGLNAATIGSFGAATVTLIVAWALRKQGQRIWREKKAETVSVTLFVYGLFSFGVLLVYGLYTVSLTIIFNGITMIGSYLPIVIGLRKFRGFTTGQEDQAAAYLMMMIVMVGLPWKETMFFVFSIGIPFSLAAQAYELQRDKKTGTVDIRLFSSFLISAAFWLAYSVAISDWALGIITFMNLLVEAVILILWFRYRNRSGLANQATVIA